MLYDAYNRVIPEKIEKPGAGRHVTLEANDREDYDISRGTTPLLIDRVMRDANSGDTAGQCRLSAELPEKNWTIGHALETRVNAYKGVEWTVEPGGDSAADKRAAEQFEEALRDAGTSNGFRNGLDTFNDLLSDLLLSLLPGFSVSEIVWKEGCSGFDGFSFIEQKHFTFISRDPEADIREPRLVTVDNPEGIRLPQNKFIVNKFRRRGSDVARGGLIRPLAWLHCFSNLNVKDLLGFIERHGMPFIVAKVDKDTWDKERNVLHSLIRNFGPSGGGVFTRSMEIELLSAATSGGQVYFKLLEYLDAAIEKVILGQTATSGSGGGLSKDDAQGQVRQDILEADCDCAADTVNTQLSAPWTAFTQPQGTRPPLFKLHCEPPEDVKAVAEAQKAQAETIEVLNRAGFEADEKEMSEKFGIKLKRVKPANAPESRSSVALGADPEKLETAAKSAGKALKGWFDPMQQYLDSIETPEDLAALAADPTGLMDKFGDDAEFVQLLSSTVYTGAAAGKAEKAEELAKKAGTTRSDNNKKSDGTV